MYYAKNSLVIVFVFISSFFSKGFAVSSVVRISSLFAFEYRDTIWLANLLS